MMIRRSSRLRALGQAERATWSQVVANTLLFFKMCLLCCRRRWLLFGAGVTLLTDGCSLVSCAGSMSTFRLPPPIPGRPGGGYPKVRCCNNPPNPRGKPCPGRRGFFALARLMKRN
jgi:hypothetical protein